MNHTQQRKRRQDPPPPRRCKGCGSDEQRTAYGFTNIAPLLGYCVACLNRAMLQMSTREGGR